VQLQRGLNFGRQLPQDRGFTLFLQPGIGFAEMAVAQKAAMG
jgi:hypothetical protein